MQGFPGRAVKPAESCSDLEAFCSSWAADGECSRNVGYMKLHACKRSCDACDLDHADLAPAAVRATEVEQKELTRVRTHGSCTARPQHLRWGVSEDLASQIGCQNREGAEPAGYFEMLPQFLQQVTGSAEPITFYDSAVKVTRGDMLATAQSFHGHGHGESNGSELRVSGSPSAVPPSPPLAGGTAKSMFRPEEDPDVVLARWEAKSQAERELRRLHGEREDLVSSGLYTAQSDIIIRLDERMRETEAALRRIEASG